LKKDPILSCAMLSGIRMNPFLRFISEGKCQLCWLVDNNIVCREMNMKKKLRELLNDKMSDIKVTTQQVKGGTLFTASPKQKELQSSPVDPIIQPHNRYSVSHFTENVCNDSTTGSDQTAALGNYVLISIVFNMLLCSQKDGEKSTLNYFVNTPYSLFGMSVTAGDYNNGNATNISLPTNSFSFRWI
jgi:hypothetical protein